MLPGPDSDARAHSGEAEGGTGGNQRVGTGSGVVWPWTMQAVAEPRLPVLAELVGMEHGGDDQQAAA